MLYQINFASPCTLGFLNAALLTLKCLVFASVSERVMGVPSSITQKYIAATFCLPQHVEGNVVFVSSLRCLGHIVFTLGVSKPLDTLIDLRDIVAILSFRKVQRFV